ncbi:MAG TPA: CsgG/HfaB family protein, partial [Candidatus Acidoferrum sp.]
MLRTRMLRVLLCSMALAVFAGLGVAQEAAPATPAASQKFVTVMNFDYGTVKTYVAQIFGSDQDVGKGISDLLVDKLLKDGKYRLIERSALDKILAEQNFSNSDRADANTAAK